MKLISLLIILTVFAGCNVTGFLPLSSSDNKKVKMSKFASNGFDNVVVSRQAFNNTIYPIVSNCASCHTGADAAPDFNLKNPDSMHDYFTQVGLITASTDKSVSSNSRVLRKVRDEKHNCGSSDECALLAKNLENAIHSWAEQAVSGVSSNGKYVTKSKNIAANLKERKAEVYRGTLLLNAEDLKGVGPGYRWKVIDHPSAVGKKYISTVQPTANPIDGARRTVQIDDAINCRTIENYNDNRSSNDRNVNGAIRYSERVRHPNQTGYIPYKQTLRAAIIDPRKRTEFANFINTNPDATIAQVSQYFLRNDAITPLERNNFDVELTEDPIFINLMGMVPPKRGSNSIQFVTSEFYQGDNGNIRNNAQVNDVDMINISDHNYFNKNWGGNDGRTFSSELNHADITALLPERELKQRVYRQVYNYYFTRFFNNDGTARSIVEGVPFFNAIPDSSSPTGVELFGYEPGASFPPAPVVDAEDQARRFLNYWLYRNNPSSLIGSGPNENLVTEVSKYVYFFVDNDFDNDDFSYNLYSDNSDYSASAPVIRNFQNISALRQHFKVDFGTTRLDLTNILLGGDDQQQVDLQKVQENYNVHVFPVISAGSNALQGYSCLNCHGDGGAQANWASSSKSTSYQVFSRYSESILDNSFVPLDPDNLEGDQQLGNPNLRILNRLVTDNHQCGSNANCDSLARKIATAVNSWHEANGPLFPEKETATIRSLVAGEREPGRAYVDFVVKESGNYALWMKFLTRGNDDQRVLTRVLDAQGKPVRFCDFEKDCPTTNATFDGKSAKEIDNMNCYTRTFNADGLGNGYWYWVTDSHSDQLKRTGWQLKPGEYRLEIIEDQVGVDIDLLALSKDPAFDPRERIVDQSYITKARPQSIEWDIEQFTGQKSKIRVDVEVTNSAYIISNPTIFSQGNQSIRANVMRILLNESFDFSNSTYLTINEVTEFNRDQGADILTNTSIIALNLAGENADSMAVSFEALNSTSARPTDNRWTPPPDGVELSCRYPEIFSRIVAPILTNTNVMLVGDNVTDSYDETVGRFPGRNGRDNDSANPNFYGCIDCHDSNHPEFPMTLFAAEGTDILCGQMLSKSRGSVEPLDDLLVFKGIDGYPGHPPIDIVQERTAWNNRRNAPYRFEQDNPADFRWRGNKSEYNVLQAYEKYTEAEVNNWINNNNWSNAQENYCRKWIGQPKRVRYLTYDSPTNEFDNDIMAEGDLLRVPTGGEISPPNFLAVPPTDAGRYYYDLLYNPAFQILNRSTPSTYNRYRDITCANMVSNNNCVNFNGGRGNIPRNCLSPKHMGSGGLMKVARSCYSPPNSSDKTICNDQMKRDQERVDQRIPLEQTYRKALKEWIRLELRALDEL